MKSFIEALKIEFPDKQVFTRPELSAVAEKYSLRKSFTEFMTTDSNKIRRGLYSLSKIEEPVELSESIVNLVTAKPIKKILIPKPPILDEKTENIESNLSMLGIFALIFFICFLFFLVYNYSHNRSI
jgi:hypothetical protein